MSKTPSADVSRKISELKPGDAVDLEGDKYADPERDHPAYEYEYQIVFEIERETADCIRVDFDGESVGFPVDHVVKVRMDFDNAQAFNEGWGIFDCDGSLNGPWQLQKLDDGKEPASPFTDDTFAWRFVWDRASEGSAYHAAALDYIMEHNALEYAFIARQFAAEESDLRAWGERVFTSRLDCSRA